VRYAEPFTPSSLAFARVHARFGISGWVLPLCPSESSLHRKLKPLAEACRKRCGSERRSAPLRPSNADGSSAARVRHIRVSVLAASRQREDENYTAPRDRRSGSSDPVAAVLSQHLHSGSHTGTHTGTQMGTHMGTHRQHLHSERPGPPGLHCTGLGLIG
jgi:hypothetical protein